MVANLSAFQKSHPVANPNPADFEPDGTWYSMVAVGGTFYSIEPNHGELDAIYLDGQIRRIADISNIQGHIVPTAVVFDGQNFFVGNLDTFPIKDGSSKIMKITPSGFITTVYIGFSDILGLAFDRTRPTLCSREHHRQPISDAQHGPDLASRRQEQLHVDCERKYLCAVSAHGDDLRSGRKSVRFQPRLRSAADRLRTGAEVYIAQSQ